MATKIYFRRGTLAQIQGIVPESGEPVWATDEKRVYVGDGTTSGGIFVGGSGVGVDTLNSLFGAITLSGGSGITVSVSGQYIIIEEEAGGLDVDSLNGLTGVVTVSGVGIVSVTEDGQKIVVSGQDVPDVDSLNALTGVVTISGTGIVSISEDGQKIVVSGEDVADVDSLNALQGAVTISGVGGVVVEVVGQIITISGGAASSFLGLTDTPESYAGQSGKVVVVNETGDGLEFTTVSGVAVSGLSDINGLVGSVEISGAGGIAVTEVDQVIVISGGGSSVGVFTDLTDTPANYTGSKHKIVTVNEGETALEFAKIVMLHNELADQDYSGLVTSGIAGETLAFGDHAVLNNQSKWVKTIATAENQTDGHIGVVVASGALDDPITLLLLGYIRDDAWSFGVGSGIYIDTTSGELSDTMPTTSGQFVRIIGYAKATSVLWYSPDNNIIELGAS
jgi:hypothetical protein